MKNEIIQTKPNEIFDLRIRAIEIIEPEFYYNNQRVLINTTLAAQNIIQNTHITDVIQGQYYKNNLTYIEIIKRHDAKNDPFPNDSIYKTLNRNCVLSGSVYALCRAFSLDLARGIINLNGTVTQPLQIRDSAVMQTASLLQFESLPVYASSILNSFIEAKLKTHKNK